MNQAEPTPRKNHPSPTAESSDAAAQRRRTREPERENELQQATTDLFETELRAEIRRIYEQSNRTFGARRVWTELRGHGIDVTRYTVEQLMRQSGLTGLRGAAGLRMRNTSS